MTTVEERILKRYYQATVRYPYTMEQKMRILRLYCHSEGIDSRALEQITTYIQREFDISDIRDADCYLLVISEDDPAYIGLRLLRSVLQENLQEGARDHRDSLRWRQDIMTEKEKNLHAIALLAYGEGRVSEAVDYWEKHVARTHDWEARIMCAIAYKELGNPEKALYHVSFALYWARAVLMLEQFPAKELFDDMIRAAGEDASSICQQASYDVEHCAGSGRRIGFF
jgi:hypothetical protein